MRPPPPDFIIIGAMRAGTTTLATRLSRHPDIGMSRLKETDYFIVEKNFTRGPLWYKELFPRDKPVRGEASPNYAKNDVFAGVPRRIHAVRPDVKLIYIVRDPVDRFWSHYTHTCLMRGGLPSPDELLDHPESGHILASSMYHRQVSAYLEFFPADQICILDFDDLASDENKTLDKVCRFIGVRTDFPLTSSDAKNASDSLAKTPGWALKLSQHRALLNLRAAAPPGLRETARRLLSRTQGAPRKTPAISDAARRRVGEALAEDAARFRALTGRAFAQWSV